MAGYAPFQPNPVFSSDYMRDALANPDVSGVEPNTLDLARGRVSNIGSFFNQNKDALGIVANMLGSFGGKNMPQAWTNQMNNLLGGTIAGRATKGVLTGNPPSPIPASHKLTLHTAYHPPGAAGSDLPGIDAGGPKGIENIYTDPRNPLFYNRDVNRPSEGDAGIVAPVSPDTSVATPSVAPPSTTPFMVKPSMDTSMPSAYTPRVETPFENLSTDLGSLGVFQGYPAAAREGEALLTAAPAMATAKAAADMAEYHKAMLPGQLKHLTGQYEQEMATAALRAKEMENLDPVVQGRIKELQASGEAFGKEKGQAEIANAWAKTPEGLQLIPDDVKAILKSPPSVKTYGDLRRLMPGEFNKLQGYINDYQNEKLRSGAIKYAADAQAKFAALMGTNLNAEIESARKIDADYNDKGKWYDPTGQPDASVKLAQQLAPINHYKVMSSEDIQRRDANRSRLRELEGMSTSYAREVGARGGVNTGTEAGGPRRRPAAAEPTYKVDTPYKTEKGGPIRGPDGKTYMIPANSIFQVTKEGKVQWRKE
jgi:hypothetical protein